MYKQVIRPLLFQLDPEKAHHLTAAAGQNLCSVPLLGRILTQRNAGAWPNLEQYLMGIRFPNPVGMAAGFDKNAGYSHLLKFLGFGYTEYGSISAVPSAGNPAPRLFRLPADHALINRMGLNNDGAETICRHIEEQKSRIPLVFRDFPTGINIAKTHDHRITGDEAIRDYLISYRSARQVADYITLNISCPNTREGKTFEEKAALQELLAAVMDEKKVGDPPVLVKFSPDNDLSTLEDLVRLCEMHRIHGYVLSNTSSRRTGLRTPETTLGTIGAGGLSGAPVFSMNLKRIAHLRSILPPEKILVGCGGIDTPDKAVKMLRAGANLLQLYTGLVYEGPALIPRINDILSEQVAFDSASTLKSWLKKNHYNAKVSGIKKEKT